MLIDFLRRGKPLSVGVAEELANMLSGVQFYTRRHGYEHGFSITVAEHKPAHRLNEKYEETFFGAVLVFERVLKDGDKKTDAINSVLKELGLNRDALRKEIAELEAICGPLPVKAQGRKKRASP